MELFFCSLYLAMAIVLTFCSGMAWESRHKYGWENKFWGIAFGVLALFLYIGTSLLWIELGEMKVETRDMPVTEKKIMHKECIGVIESDTLYVFKFE